MAQDKNAARPVGWYHGWNIVAVCILSQVAANGLTYNAFSLFLRDWSAELHTPVSRLQLPVAAMGLTAAVLAPVAGILSDKYPPRRLFTFGLLGIAFFYLAMSAMTAVWQMLALYGLVVPLALVLSTSIPANALIARWFVRRRGLALGLSAFGVGMAGVLLPPVIAVALPEFGWRMIWRAGGFLVALVVLPLVVFVIRNRPTEEEGRHYLTGDATAHLHHGHSATGGSLGWRDVVARRNFWILVAVYLPMLALNGGVGQNLAPYAASHGLGQESAGVLISVLSLSHVVATLVFGLISDRFGNCLPFAGLAAVVATGGAVLAFGDGLPAITAGCVLVGFAGGLYTLLAAAIAAEFGSAGFGRAFGLVMLFIPVSAFSPFIIATTQEKTGSYAPALMGMVLLVIVGGGLSLLLREKRGGHLTTDEKDAVMEEAVNPLA